MKHSHALHFLTAIDRRFADVIARLSGSDAPELWLAAALASNAVQRGHVCLDLRSVAGKPLPETDGGDKDAPVCPDWDSFLRALEGAGAVGSPGEFKPLVLDSAGRLYLYRYWQYERIVAQSIRARAGTPADRIDLQLLREGLDRMFPSAEDGPDYQRISAHTAVCRRLAVITGGPGTGKTSTVVNILALLLEQQRGTRIALAAPTGKAAARLAESVKNAKKALNCPPEIIALIPEEASTLHRLLGALPHSTRFRFDENNPLSCDAVAVDEASMIDLPLMAKLLRALPADCRIILLGDRDQLASVQPGAVFGDICGGLADPAATGDSAVETVPDLSSLPGLHGSVVTLRKSFRFGEASGIGAVSRYVNQGNGDVALAAATGGSYPDILWKDLPSPGTLESELEKTVLGEFGPYLGASAPEMAFAAFSRFRILCAVREGPFGVAAVNEAAMRILGRAGLIQAHERWFRGRPVLVTRNDYQVKLFNGDVGIVYPDADDPAAGFPKRVFFPSEAGGFRKLLPMRLPEHETVYAMTVHKSQGSEFERVLLILPKTQAPVLTRELIYTGITRGMQKVEIWGSRAVFREAVGRRIERTSGLRDSLWKA